MAYPPKEGWVKEVIRIWVEETKVESVNKTSQGYTTLHYTQGERKWKQSTITIDGVRRSDDGLYECQAENEGGRFYKSGHIQVGPKKG